MILDFFLTILIVAIVLYVVTFGKDNINTAAYTIAKHSTVEEITDRKVEMLFHDIIYEDLCDNFVKRTVPDEQILFALSKLEKDNFKFTLIVNYFNVARKKYEDMLRWEEERGKDMYP